MSQAHNVSERDSYRWLEDVTGEAALDWVRARNATSLAELSGGARFSELRDGIREVLDADDRIPFVTRRGDYLYNFWQEAARPKGLWRRTTLDEYRRDRPDWDVLLDVDELAEAEGENWVWHGATVLRPGGYRRALIYLSIGGADASVVREFDLERRRFATDGFYLPEAKNEVGWIDEDTIYVGTDFGPGSLTTSGYPRLVKEWRRGTPLADAVTVYEGKPEDVGVSAFRDHTEGFERDLVTRGIDFFRNELYLRAGGDLIKVDVPDDADVTVHREWLLIRTRSPWDVNSVLARGDALPPGGHPRTPDGPGPTAVTHPPGALLAARFDAYLAGDRELTVLFEPDSRTSLSYHARTRDHVILVMLRDVRSMLAVMTPVSGQWRRDELPGVPDYAQADIVQADPFDSQEYMLYSSGFTQPGLLRYGQIGGESEPVKRAPSFFDASAMSVRQFFATSDDGTAVPYFVTGSGSQSDGPRPTLLTGYGGFEHSLTPSYSGVVGRGWLARGGTYAVANLRGGGEYGPRWHMSATRENRHLVHEDFAAVAADLVRRGITTPDRLGIEGGSSGGLLMGVMLTRYPALFGAIVAQVPLFDMLRYHELLAGASWIAEYGDPRDPAEREYLRLYSPYHNVSADRKYPPVLLMTSTRDDRVHPGHARKMAALLAELGHEVSYYENIEGGHSAGADNEQRALNSALMFEFLWEKLADRDH